MAVKARLETGNPTRQPTPEVEEGRQGPSRNRREPTPVHPPEVEEGRQGPSLNRRAFQPAK